eukprot:augustus_masked-scaffold_7-processed-gene-19.101-mRNA-1 protein AED:1.00 eAED:1.00 QI:0/-1/0/0/-1/1/1/0/321
MNNIYRQSVVVNQKVKKQLSCCQKASRNWVLCLNFVVFVIGVFLLSFCLIQVVNQGEEIEALGEAGLLGASIASGVLIFTSLLGFYGAGYRKKFVLILYVCLLTALAAAFTAVGVIFLFLVDDLANVDGQDAEDLGGTVEGRLNDFLIAVFNECCGENFGLDKLLGCSDPEANLDACFTFEGTYEAALDRVRTTGLCDVLEATEVEVDLGEGQVILAPVVGDPADLGCAGGDGVLFKQLLTDVFEDALEPLGFTFFATGVLLLFTDMCTCVLLCAKQDEYVKEYNQSAPYIAGTGNALPPPNTYPNYGENPYYGSKQDVRY